MKKLALIAGLFMVTIAYAAPRMVLFEEYTSVMG
jgi:hypothetical protein